MNTFYDNEYAKKFNKIKLTKAQNAFISKVRREQKSWPRWSLSRWGMLRLIGESKGWLVDGSGRVTLEYNL